MRTHTRILIIAAGVIAVVCFVCYLSSVKTEQRSKMSTGTNTPAIWAGDVSAAHYDEIGTSTLATTTSGSCLRDTINRHEFVTCITQTVTLEWRREAAIAQVDKRLFGGGNETVSITGAFDTLLFAELTATNRTEDSALCAALKSMRFRALIPHLSSLIIASEDTNTIRVAYAAHACLKSLEHPDTLRTWLALNDQIPTNSVLRQGAVPAWPAGVPLFSSPSCLPVYFEILRNPAKYTWGEWAPAIGAIIWFTNQEAVVELRRSIQTMRYWRRYWPDDNPGIDVYSGSVYMRLQRDLIEGKQKMPAIPPPLFDE